MSSVIRRLPEVEFEESSLILGVVNGIILT